MRAINGIKDSATYRQLSDRARAAIESLPDEQQFLAVAASRGAQTYGKTTSQAVESQNAHLLKARSVDLVSSVFEVASLETERYNKNYMAAHSHEGLMTPWARSRLSALKQLSDDVTEVTNPEVLAENITRIFVVVTDEGKRFTVKLVNPLGIVSQLPSAVETVTDQTFFTDGVETAACSCGIPLRDRFPCDHMVTVARVMSLPEELLVPPEFLTYRWRKQYPDDFAFRVPKKVEAELSVVPRDETLSLPMICPPKRGRPNKRRMKSAVERAKKHRRRNAPTNAQSDGAL